MNMRPLGDALKTTGQFINNNASSILTGLGVSGFLTTIWLAAEGGKKSSDDIYNYTDGNISFKEEVKLTWKNYIPTGIMGAATVACFIGANTVESRRRAAIAGAYALSEAAMDEYKQKVKELIGEKKEKEVKHEVYKERIKKDPPDETIIFSSNSETLCYDYFSGRYFYSDIEKLRKVQNELNARLLNDLWISLNDVYYEINAKGLEPNGVGDNVGWNFGFPESNNNLIEFIFSSQLTESGEPCLVVDFNIQPKG